MRIISLAAALVAGGALLLSSPGGVAAAPPGADDAGFIHFQLPQFGLDFYCTPDATDGNGVCFPTAGGRLSVFIDDAIPAVPNESSGFVHNPLIGGEVKMVENGVPAGP